MRDFAGGHTRKESALKRRLNHSYQSDLPLQQESLDFGLRSLVYAHFGCNIWQIRATRLQAEVEALHFALEKLNKEMKAESETLQAVTKEKAELQVQLQAEREAFRAVAQKKAGA